MDDIKALTQNFCILYVEDEETIRNAMTHMLQFYFKEIIVGVDGQDGLEKFNKNRQKIDFIISDIQMPKLSGLDMIQKIREIDSQIPIVITTAFNEQDYFIRSIELKIDKYLLKPIRKAESKDTFYAIAKMLTDRKKAKELDVIRFQEKINQISDSIADQMIQNYQSPTLIVDDKKVKYVNSSFCEFIDMEQANLKHFNSIEDVSFFDTKEGYLSDLAHYKENSSNKVSISTTGKRKIYKVQKKNIELQEEKLVMYIFYDITYEEYQKVKISNYNYMLQEFIFHKHYSSITKKAQEQEIQKLHSKHIEDEQKEILRKSHTYKTTAKEYLSELDDEILLELQELDELDKDFKESITLFKEEQDFSSLNTIAMLLQKYAHEIGLLFEFEDLGYALKSLSALFMELKEDKVIQVGANNIAMLLEAIESDLKDWRRLIFIEQSAVDIHYIDSSLFSSCLQLELLFSDEIDSIDTDEGDLEFF